MKNVIKNIITAVLIAVLLSTMAACGSERVYGAYTNDVAKPSVNVAENVSNERKSSIARTDLVNMNSNDTTPRKVNYHIVDSDYERFLEYINYISNRLGDKKGYILIDDYMKDNNEKYLIISKGQVPSYGYDMKVSSVQATDSITQVLIEEWKPQQSSERGGHSYNETVDGPYVVLKITEPKESIVVKNVDGEQYNLLEAPCSYEQFADIENYRGTSFRSSHSSNSTYDSSTSSSWSESENESLAEPESDTEGGEDSQKSNSISNSEGISHTHSNSHSKGQLFAIGKPSSEGVSIGISHSVTEGFSNGEQ